MANQSRSQTLLIRMISKLIAWCAPTSVKLACVRICWYGNRTSSLAVNVEAVLGTQIYLTNGALAVYEAFPSISSARQSPREATLGARFVKTSMRRLPAPIIRKGKRAEGQDDLPPPKRDFVPFSNLSGFTGLFSTGEDPVWIIATDHGPAQILDHADKGIYGFAVSDETGCYTVQTRQVSVGG